MPLKLASHPLVDDAMARLRDKATPCEEFRALARRVSVLLVAEATRDLPTESSFVETPLERAPAQRLTVRVVAVPVLRAGLGMLDAFLELVPSAEVGYFGLERNEQTAIPRRYYEKVPKDLGSALTFLLDPMLATGGSAAMAIEGLRDLGARDVRLLSIVASPEGVALLARQAPDVVVYAAALDRELNDKKYILPGLGDFGDRLFKT
ncbi:MAG TPA: uracil phosphoribosyltransferase [Vicinamibacteria bacterium]